LKNIENFLKPNSVAIVGASNNHNSIAGKPIHYLIKHGFKGEIYPVNPKYEKIQGLQSYKDILSLPEPVDVIMLIVRAEKIFEQVKLCAKKGIKNVLVVSSGFAETGTDGFQLQTELVDFCRENSISLFGPNSQGIVSLVNQSTLSFSAALERESLIVGDVGFISQSGAFGNSVFSLAQDQGIGFAHIACTGNEADINTFDLIEFMLKDQNVKIVACYNEGFQDANQIKYLSFLSKKEQKPIVWFKAGKSESGKKAASSHTGAISGEDAIFNKLLKQYGMLRVNDIHELFDTLEVFRQQRLARGTRIGVLTTSGGTGVMLADELEELGSKLTEFSADVQEQLSQVLPSFASLNNPIDITAQVVNEPELFKLAGEILIKNKAVDVICISLTMVLGKVAEEIIDTIIELYQNTDIPIVISWTINEKRVEKAAAKLKSHNIPLFQTPVRSAHAIHKLIEYSQAFLEHENEVLHDPIGKIDLKEWIREHRINEFTVKSALKNSGFSITRECLVQTEEEALHAANQIEYPVVLKVVSEDIPHKTEVGGVILNIKDKEELGNSFKEIKIRLQNQGLLSKVDGYLVQEMAEKGIELILGASNKKPFGPIVTVGLGGVWVEVLKDVTYRQAPFTVKEAKKMLTELKSYPLLQGVRGSKPIDLDHLCEEISKFSWLIASIPDIEEIEINPLIVTDKGVKIVDALCLPKSNYIEQVKTKI